MKAVSADELRNNLGHANYCISPLSEGTPAVLSHHLGSGEYVDTVERVRAGGHLMDAAVALFSTYNFLLARFAWPELIETGLIEGLSLASQKPWREAVTILASHGKALVASFGDEDGGDGEEDGAAEGVAADASDTGEDRGETERQS